MTDGRLAGKIVLLTGIGGGMGRETARLFAREGATVVGCDLNEESAAETVRLIEAEGGSIDSSAPVDLGQREAIDAWINGAVERFGKVDVLYNNASMPKFAPFAQMSGEDYRFTIQNELDLVWHACQSAWPHLAKSGGAIVNIGSVAGVQGARALPQAAHAAAKGAVIALTKQLAAEGIAVGVRVNCVSPGVMATPPILAMYAELGDKAPVAPIVERTISGKPGDPLAVAYAGLYFASDEAKWVTGSHLVVDGGAHAVM
ncbi:SDR family NAD(P)-dependent oxidoreductase [Glutamicibacter sp. HZAU]|uniref:SDR family NAD(P)-dependent oxidoreductase n=1 Tax=Glutamicibacter sp. HZAU TaxID=2049891 RepID=UPI000FFCAF3C|nr:SDR family NAD(P)-dependent oxidoreductase [Glutamicibacter sp. HZAU]RWZ85356.1 SDR family oxidoreductase [Glutamicibacter sp. HZAU]